MARPSPSSGFAPEALARVRSAHRRQADELIDAFRTHLDPDRLLRGLCALTDATVRELWRGTGLADGALIAAVGGYGRGEIFPHSDVDLLILTEAAPDEFQRAAIEGFVGACWDAGLPIGHSVRTFQECLQEAAADVTVQTSTLEARLLGGSAPLFERLVQSLAAGQSADSMLIQA